METVKLSKLKLQNIFKDSESIHLKSWIDTGVAFKPTSKKAVRANRVVISTQREVKICAPVTPTFLPQNPEIIDPNKGSTIMARYII